MDTFRFEEKALLKYCDKLISEKRFADARKLVQDREPCFWVKRDVNRQSQWEAARMMAQLAQKLKDIRDALKSANGDPARWIKAYADSWHEADQIHRNLECLLAQSDHESELDQSLQMVRKEYDEVLRLESIGFASAMKSAKWSVKGIVSQTESYKTLVSGAGGPVAYFLVDSLRYEMAVELASKLSEAKDLFIRPSVGVLPSITPIGMAALLPEASAGFSIDEQKGKLVARIGDTLLPGVTERMKYFKSRVPDLVEVTLGKLLQTAPKTMPKLVGNSSLIVVRSQEIDALGESGGDLMARQIMDTIIGNICRAIRKLAGAGIERFAIAADHGHQFASRKEKDMRIDSPNGNELEIHRRCWVGRGGQTQAGTVKVQGAELGYQTDLELIFPEGLGVFKTQGGLCYHHGGFSLQEIVVPLVSFRMPLRKAVSTAPSAVRLNGLPDTLTNRTFGIEISVPQDLFEKDSIDVRVILLSGPEQVGQAGMVLDAEFDRASGIIKLPLGKKISVGVMLARDDAKKVKVVVQEASTEAVLAESEEIPVKLSI